MALFSNYMSRYPSQFDPELSAEDPRQKSLMIDRLRQLAQDRLNVARSQASAPTMTIGAAGRGLPINEDAYYRGMQQDIDIANYARGLGNKPPLETEFEGGVGGLREAAQQRIVPQRRRVVSGARMVGM